MAHGDPVVGAGQNPGLPALHPGPDSSWAGNTFPCPHFTKKHVLISWTSNLAVCPPPPPSCPLRAHSWAPDEFGQQWVEGTLQKTATHRTVESRARRKGNGSHIC